MSGPTTHRIGVALSGGVDSSVTAALLKRQGHDVFGVTLRLLGADHGACGSDDTLAAAHDAADALGIALYVVDGLERFDERVLEPSWRAYESGRTPNPCARCNPHLKFGLLLDRARELGAELIATGHHARVESIDGEPALLRGHDPNKDQSYFLCMLTAEQLSAVRFPVGELTKQRVREIAAGLRLPAAKRAESQDACLAQRSDLAEALRDRFGGQPRPGRIIDRGGKVLGEHEGVHRYTIGQRKGLGVALGRPAYVVAIDPARAEVVVDTDADALLADGLRAAELNWLVPPAIGEPAELEVQIRYRHQPVPATVVRCEDGTAEVRFAEPERAVSPGQAAVFYRGDRVLGGGWIERALPV